MDLVTSAAKQNEDNMTGLLVHLANLSYKLNTKSTYNSHSGPQSMEDLVPAQALLLNLYFEFPNMVSSLLSHYSPLPVSPHSTKSQVCFILLAYICRLFTLFFLVGCRATPSTSAFDGPRHKRQRLSDTSLQI